MFITSSTSESQDWFWIEFFKNLTLSVALNIRLLFLEHNGFHTLQSLVAKNKNKWRRTLARQWTGCDSW